jgi:hypothetical protein
MSSPIYEDKDEHYTVLKNWAIKEYTENSISNMYFLVYPEFAVKKLKLPENLLYDLPTNNRNREDIYNWIATRLITGQMVEEDFYYAGI